MKSITLNKTAIQPSKIVCIGRNYVDHIKELGNEMPAEPVIFVKPNSAISTEVRSGDQEAIHYEGEITFVIQAGQAVAVGFGLDLTKREMQSRLKSKGLPWERAKAFDGAAVFSRFVSCPKQLDLLRMELLINDQLTQSGGYELMIHKPEDVIAEIQSFMSLDNGDLVMTGTPAGVGALTAGDRFAGRIFDGETLLLEQHWVVQ